tara:strand:- start:17396 stop:17845 length:450 start_codon:yes stop_codon:yes gene_type:complete
MTQSVNQFGITSEVGSDALAVNSNVITCRIDPASVATDIVSGQAVVLVDTASTEILVDKAAAATDAIVGFVKHNPVENNPQKGALVEVMLDNSFMRMEASAAIARGATLQITTDRKVVTQTTGTKIGVCLDKAAASGALVRVMIKTPIL